MFSVDGLILFLCLPFIMLLDVIPYLSKNKGLSLSNIGLDLKLVDMMYRFDSNRFDILAYDYSGPDTRIYGLKNLKVDVGLDGLQKIVDDAKWLERFNGHVIALIPASNKRLHGVFDDVPELITTKYYLSQGKEYCFLDDISDYAVVRHEAAKETASKIITSPQVIDFFLKQFEKKSTAIKLARGLFNAYNRTKR